MTYVSLTPTLVPLPFNPINTMSSLHVSPLAALSQELQPRVFSARQLMRPATTEPIEPEEIFPTGCVQADHLLGGGIQRCETIEIIGNRTSGRFSLVLSTLSSATRVGESVALVDLGDHFDPQIADHAGLDLQRLLWLRPRHMKQALGSAELLLTTGFSLVVLDLGVPPVPGGRGAESSWLRLSRAAQAHRGTLLVSSPYRVSGIAARVVLEIRRSRHHSGRWQGRGSAPRLLLRLHAELELMKRRARRFEVEAMPAGVASVRSVENLELRTFTSSVEYGSSPLDPVPAPLSVVRSVDRCAREQLPEIRRAS